MRIATLFLATGVAIFTMTPATSLAAGERHGAVHRAGPRTGIAMHSLDARPRVNSSTAIRPSARTVDAGPDRMSAANTTALEGGLTDARVASLSRSLNVRAGTRSMGVMLAAAQGSRPARSSMKNAPVRRRPASQMGLLLAAFVVLGAIGLALARSASHGSSRAGA